jgi:hypothetical protein
MSHTCGFAIPIAMPEQTTHRHGATIVLKAVPLYDSPVVIADRTTVSIKHPAQSR